MARGVKAGWNGGISGVAGFCPELMVRLYRSVVRGQTTETGRLEALVHELIERISVFPTPWGVRIGLAARGIETGPLPLPLPYAAGSRSRHSTPGSSPGCSRSDAARRSESGVLESVAASHCQGERHYEHHEAREPEQRP